MIFYQKAGAEIDLLRNIFMTFTIKRGFL